jgi:hypothetical protein
MDEQGDHMRNRHKLLALLALCGILNSCGSDPFGDSDPLADQPDSVKAGETPFKPKPIPEKPLPEDVLKVDFTAGGYVFREGIESEFTITGRSMFDESMFQMEAVNIAEFKDATVTTVAGDKIAGVPASLTFKWKPPVGFVFSDKLVVTLEVSISTTNLAENYSFKTNIPILIYNEAFAVPRILSVTGLPQKVKEAGLASKFRVDIEDLESKDVNGERPTLLFLSKSSGISLAPFIEVVKTTKELTPGKWSFEVSINLADVEITKASNTGYFDVVAISGNSVQSNPYNVALQVLTSVSLPITTWTEAAVFKVGSNNTFSFTVLDPKAEGQLSVDFVTQCASIGVLSKPTCSCKVVGPTFGKPQSTQICTIEWEVAANEMVGNKFIDYKAKNSSPVTTDNDYKELTFQGKIQLK